MDKQTQEAILKWILDNHQDHEFVYTENRMDDDEQVCDEGNSPYVNSLELDKFILSLGVHESSDKV